MKHWKMLCGLEAYLGMMVSDFPNSFHVLWPEYKFCDDVDHRRFRMSGAIYGLSCEGGERD